MTFMVYLSVYNNLYGTSVADIGIERSSSTTAN